LQHHPEAWEPFAKALAMIARDNRRDPTTRDYAIQHLRQLCDASSNDTSLRDAMVATFEQLADQDAVVAAPALLSLHLIGREDSRGSSASGPKSGSHAYPDASIQQHLSPVFAQTTHAGNIALRMTAARIAGERRLDSCRQALLDQVFDSSEHTMVRMAAANAIGRIGNPDDLQKLGSFPPGDERVTTAVRHALRNRTPL
jgi:HEAT repeat protein